jgi:hypothetical protein
MAESGNVFGVTPRLARGADIKQKDKSRFYETVTYYLAGTSTFRQEFATVTS